MKFNGRRADMHMRTFILVYTQKAHTCKNGRHRVNRTHQINTVCICGRSTNAAGVGVGDEDLAVVLPLPKSQNTAGVCLWVREGIGSLSKYPYT